MKGLKTKKGFTLIELLIVIAIIGILAVAFLPSLLSAPAKGRDTQRVANLSDIQEALLFADLEGKEIPGTDGCTDTVINTLVTGTYEADDIAVITSSLGGAVPEDPTGVTAAAGTCADDYIYLEDPDEEGTYMFGLVAKMETEEAANADCTYALAGTISAIDPADEDTWCYAILAQ